RQQKVLLPEQVRRFARQVAPQKVAPLAPTHFAKLLLVESEKESGELFLPSLLLLSVDVDVDQAPGATGLRLRGAEPHHQLIARELHLLTLLEPRPQLLQPAAPHASLLRNAVGTFHVNVKLVLALLHQPP